MEQQPKRLYRDTKNKVLFGVCAGFAEYFGWDPTWVRLFYVVITFFCAIVPGTLVYLIAAIIIPTKPDNQITP